MSIRQKSLQELHAQHQDALLATDDGSIPARWDMVGPESLERYIQILRTIRRQREDYYRCPIEQFVSAIQLDRSIEAGLVQRMSARVIDVVHAAEHTEEIEKAFPSGTMLFHGAKTSAMVSILKTGYLMNARALGKRSERDSNGGEEGISWSLGDIEAIPGSRYHMAGFVAAPEKILGTSYQLAVPENPAPYEVVQLSQNIDAAEFYETYTQVRLLELVYDAIAQLAEDTDSVTPVEAHVHSDATDWYYKDADGEVVLSRKLPSFVDRYGERALAELWLHASMAKNNTTPVWVTHALLECALEALESRIVTHASELKKNICVRNDVRIPVEALYLVVPRDDLDKWLKVIVRCPAKPAGIIAYDSSTVRLEDFASSHRGDGRALATQLRQVIPPSDKTVEFKDVLGAEFDDSLRTSKSYGGHAIAPEHLMATKRIVLSPHGNVVIAE